MVDENRAHFNIFLIPFFLAVAGGQIVGSDVKEKKRALSYLPPTVSTCSIFPSHAFYPLLPTI